MKANHLGGRLPLLAPANLSPQARLLYERLIENRLGGASPFTSRISTGELIGPFNVLLHAPTVGEGFIDFHEAEEHATPLSARVREVVILSVGAVWASAYELYAHCAVANRIGLSPDVVAILVKGEACDQLSVEERAAQRFTLELVQNRAVNDNTYSGAEQAFGSGGLVALVLLAAAYCATCLLLNAFAVPAPAQ